MKRILLTALISIMGITAMAQIAWISDFKHAQTLAHQSNKLILLDFWAVWCGPCKTMDDKLWYTEEMKNISTKVIPVKVDVDRAVTLARNYNASSIPMVLIVDASGAVIWRKVGFDGFAQNFIDAINGVPEDVSELNALLLKENESYDHQFQLAMAYQKLAENTESPEIKEGLLDLSDDHFKTVAKKSENTDLIARAELLSLLNYSIKGQVKKAIKKLEKTDLGTESDEIKELKTFIMAYCYKCDGDEKRVAEVRSNISNAEYLKRLDSN